MPSTSIWHAIDITKFNNSPEYKAAKANTAFRPNHAGLLRNPRLPAFTTDPAPITMPDTLVLSNDKSRRLRCVIERESVVLTVTVPRDSEVDDLKTAIRNRGILLDVAPTA